MLMARARGWNKRKEQPRQMAAAAGAEVGSAQSANASERRPPLYESTFLWGSLGLAGAVVLGVILPLLRDIRWGLWLALPFAVMFSWSLSSYVVPKRWILGATLLLSLVWVGLLSVLYYALPHPPTTDHPDQTQQKKTDDAPKEQQPREPPPFTQEQLDEAVRKAMPKPPPHQDDEIKGPLLPGDDQEPDSIKESLIAWEKTHSMPAGALKICLGSSVGITTAENATILTLANRKLLSIHRREQGRVFVDAQIFGTDGRIMAEFENNVPHFNPKHVDYWLSERPDKRTLIVKDQFGDKILEVYYLNKSAVQIMGTFRYAGRIVLVSASDTVFNRAHFSGGVFTFDGAIKSMLDFN